MIPVFKVFGLSHFLVIILSILLTALVFITRKWHFSNQEIIAKILGFGGLLFFPIHFLIYFFVIKSFDIRFDLPILQVCGITLLSSSLYLVLKNSKLKSFFYNILFFWGVSAILTSFLTPALVEDFPHIYFWLFWISHWLIVYILSFILIIKFKTVTYSDLWKSVLSFFIFLSFIYPFNLLTSSNYVFLSSKPEIIKLGVIGGIDFDKSPNYILFLILIGIVVFHGIYFTHRLFNQKLKLN